MAAVDPLGGRSVADLKDIVSLVEDDPVKVEELFAAAGETVLIPMVARGEMDLGIANLAEVQAQVEGSGLPAHRRHKAQRQRRIFRGLDLAAPPVAAGRVRSGS